MKLDIDLIKNILCRIEEESSSGDDFFVLTMPEYPDEAVQYHLRMLHNHGLIEARNLQTLEGDDWVPISLTLQGHDFLARSRQTGVWNRLKQEILQLGGSVTIAWVKQTLLQLPDKFF